MPPFASFETGNLSWDMVTVGLKIPLPASWQWVYICPSPFSGMADHWLIVSHLLCWSPTLAVDYSVHIFVEIIHYFFKGSYTTFRICNSIHTYITEHDFVLQAIFSSFFSLYFILLWVFSSGMSLIIFLLFYWYEFH